MSGLGKLGTRGIPLALGLVFALGVGSVGGLAAPTPAAVPGSTLGITAVVEDRSVSPGGCGTLPAELTVTAETTGGTPPIRFTWTFGNASPEAGGATITYADPDWGNVNGSVVASDATGASAERNFSLQNYPPPCPAPVDPVLAGNPPPIVLFVAAAAVVGVVAAVLLVARRPRRGAPRSAEEGGA